MDFLNDLRAARTSTAAALQWFLVEYASNPTHVFVFHEGYNDPSYYTNFIIQYVPEINRLRYFRCGNKNEVYNAHAKITPRVSSRGIILFFVDKDLSDILPENRPVYDNIYVTDWYSIENYLVSSEMFTRYWNEIIRIRDTGHQINPIELINQFETALSSFYCVIIPIMAWIIHTKRCGQRPNVNNINLSRIFEIDDNLSIVLSTESQQMGTDYLIERMTGVNTPLDFNSVRDDILAELDLLPTKSFVRGKFELWFFIKYIAKFRNVLRRTSIGENASTTFDLTEANAIDILASRTRIPHSLAEFLSLNLPEYNNHPDRRS